MSQQLVKKVAALLVDTTMTVREVAAGTLRCGVASFNFCINGKEGFLVRT